MFWKQLWDHQRQGKALLLTHIRFCLKMIRVYWTKTMLNANSIRTLAKCQKFFKWKVHEGITYEMQRNI